MKRVLCVALSLMVLLCFAACKSGDDSPATIASLKYIGERDLKVKFDSITTLKSIMDDTSIVDINMTMGSISGLEIKTEKNEENGSSIDYYYRGKERIYAVYNGYSENLWQYFTTSKTGVPLIVSFWDEGEVANVEIAVDENYTDLGYTYKVRYENLGTDYGNGAEVIEASVTKDGETYTYHIDGNYYYICQAIYLQDEQLHRFTADADDGKIIYHYDEIIISTEVPVVSPDDEAMLEQALSSEFKSVDILLGKHQIYKDTEGDMFINAETTLVFESEKDAEDAIHAMQMMGVKASDFTVERDKGDRYYIVNIGTYLFALSPDFEDGKKVLTGFAIDEFDDFVYKSVTFDSENRITGFGEGDISYY
ncbi:MAG: hypothetical protein II473_00855 [Clostridia bacterium]|nr:hypothetical protein [Clostridia bacterium]MBQ2091719.1 hypothetical protein [Clostridia bacterium]MBQ2500208.1 hypothetical protein [Clostridia bacterium]MBQ3896969.1 hypothetical protein [Clostridia bacterium]